MEEELYTVREIAEKFNLPYTYVATVSQRPHYKHFFEKREIEKLKKYPNGRYYPYVYKSKILKPEFKDIFFKRMEVGKQEKHNDNAPFLDKQDIPLVYHWTASAVQCYVNRGNCEFCSNWELVCRKAAMCFIDKKPPMRKAMIKLLAQNGRPPYNLLREIEETA
jgi:hypothetical protein